MQIFRDIPVAVGSLRGNPLRTFLTLLGISVGIGAVMYVVMLGEVAQARIRERLEALGANVLIVRPGNARMRGVSQSGTRESLTWQDARDIVAESAVIREAVPEFSGSGQVEFQGRSHQTRITGTLPTYETVNKHSPTTGRWFRDSEANRSARVAVLGADVVQELFPNGDAIGEMVAINDVRFEIIGVLESKGGGWRNPDDQVFVPLMTAQRRLFGADHITTMYAQVQSSTVVREAFFDIETILRRNHRLRPDQDNDFRIRKQDVFLSTVQETNQEVARLILLIALVSLIVGGIGIANVMLISVVERTREIGVRRAIGARRRDIMGQFLVESGLLGVLGGLVGLLGGAILCKFALPPVASFPLQWVVYSCLICIAVGVTSGLYPAVKAAHLDVIDAIRYE
jgi:putative ABC transport system permease protein